MGKNTPKAALNYPVFNEITRLVREERIRQLEKWGRQSHPDTEGDITRAREAFTQYAAAWKRENDENNQPAWDSIFLEEFYEYLADGNKAELIQCAAVIFAWIEDLGARK